MIRVLDRALRSQHYVLLLRGISVAVWLATLVALLGNTGLFDAVPNLHMPLRILVNTSVGLIVLVALAGVLPLWISVIYYWRHYDVLTAVMRVVWFVIIIFGFCFGASAYLWLRVTAVSSGKIGRAGEVAAAKRSLTRALKVLTLVSLGTCLITGLLDSPAHPLVPQEVLAAIVLLLVPVTFLLTLAYIIAAVFERG